MSVTNRIKTEIRDFTVYFALPLIAMILPWRYSYKICRWYCNKMGSMGINAAAVQKNLALLGQQAMQDTVLTRLKLVLLMDIIDMWRGVFLGERALKKLVNKMGDWPVEQSIVIGTHVGVGILSLQSMRSSGIQPYYIIRSISKSMTKGRFFLHHYFKIRVWYHNKVLPGKWIDTNENPRKLIKLIKNHQPILMLSDAPPLNDRRTIQFKIKGHVLLSHAGIVNIIAKNEVPIVTYCMYIDWQTGRRQLVIDKAVKISDEQGLKNHISEFMERTIGNNLDQWQLLPHMQALRPRKASSSESTQGNIRA